MTIQQALQQAKVDRLDAELLLCFCLQVQRSYLYAWSDKTLTEAQQQQFLELAQQRQHGKPLAYITGIKEFWSLPLQVNNDTLIPRPDTECIVEKALEKLSCANQTIFDLGTGSGAIALALASECPTWSIIATDIHSATLASAQHNAQQLNLTQVQFIHSGWFENLPAIKADAIISNPPYIKADDEHLQNLQYEPQRALVAPNNGLADLYHLIENAKSHLKTGGFLLLEHGFEQKQAVQQKMQDQGYHHLETCYDLAGHARGSWGLL